MPAQKSILWFTWNMFFAAVAFAPTLRGAEPGPGSYQVMDYGPVIAETIIASWPEDNIAHKGLAVRLDHDSTMIFDTDLLRWSAASAGGWIDLSQSSHTSYKGMRPPVVEGREIFATAPLPGWARTGSFQHPREEGRGELPGEWAFWRGFYRFGDRVALSYTVGETAILESPAAIKVENSVVFARAISTSGAGETMVAYVAQAHPGSKLEWRDGSMIVRNDTRTLGLRFESGLKGAELRLEENGRVELFLPAHSRPAEMMVLVWEEAGDRIVTSGALRRAARQAVVDFAKVRQGGPARWSGKIETSVAMAEEEAAYVTDRIPLPVDNPWGAWIRPSGLDFFADGDRAAISTWNGDVWIASGLRGTGNRVSWRRFASGLFYPMGLVILNDTIHVTERGQLTRLHDLNGNGEADFYENVNNAGFLHPMAHSLCLDVDSAGNFYFFKNGNRVPGTVAGHGALIRISADGATREVFASGIRGANGLGIGPGDMILGVDQQGDWVPTARVDWLRAGGFYGYRPHNPDGRPEGDYDEPICWIPHRVDNSSGDLLFVEDERWGPMRGNWLITSYGQGRLLALLMEEKGGQPQGGVVPFSLEFSSGLMRARTNPGDGQLYLLGLKGWGTAARDEGSFDRVRYTGLPDRMPIGLGVKPGVVRIDFSETIDPESATVENVDVERWQYLYSSRYGSPEMSVADPEEPGRDSVAVSSVGLSDDGKSLLIAIPDLKPVMQQSVSYRLRFADGAAVENTVYHTMHRLSDEDVAPVRDLMAPAKVTEALEKPPGSEDETGWAAFAAGRAIFENTCSTCHQPDGNGAAPALSTSAWMGGDTRALIRIVLQGKLGDQGAMMPFAFLSDDDIASVLSYIRVRWHEEDEVSSAAVRSVREATSGRAGLWTAEELSEFQR